jgi:serralysin
VEQTASGYEVAWKVGSTDQYVIWNTDSNGNYLSDGGVLSGTSIVLEAAETSLHQDLNGDGRIGVPPTVIEAFGSTRLDLAGSTYSLDPVTGGSGPSLKYHGAAVVPGQFGSSSGLWAPIGVEQTASGYEVAWKVAGADQYMVWNTDSTGNYISDGGVLSGTSIVLEAAETSLHQDLNGDGVIGDPAGSPGDGPGGPAGPNSNSLIGMNTQTHVGGTAPTSDSFVFRADLGTGPVADSGHANTADLDLHSPGLPGAVASSGQAAGLELLIQQPNGSHDMFNNQDHLTPFNHIADLHAGGVFIH